MVVHSERRAESGLTLTAFCKLMIIPSYNRLLKRASPGAQLTCCSAPVSDECLTDETLKYAPNLGVIDRFQDIARQFW